jgi:hypothetical protein
MLMRNELETIRLRLGISRPELLRWVGARVGREGLFFCLDPNVDPIFLERARELGRLYDAWVREVLGQVDEMGPMSPRELADLLDTYPIRLLRLRQFGMLGPDGDSTWDAVTRTISPADVRAMFTANEQFLEHFQSQGYGKAAPRRAPLSTVFYLWATRLSETERRRLLRARPREREREAVAV